MSKSLRKQLIFVGLETGGYSQEAVPTTPILCGNITINPLEGDSVQRKNIKPYQGNQGSIRVSGYVKLSFEVEWAGSGAAGTAPAHGVLKKMCNMSEQILAAPVTGTAQAGGSSTSIKLAAGASATSGYYVGMPLGIVDGGGAGYSGRVTAYDGTSKVAAVTGTISGTPDATSEYSIGANTIYIPNSNSALAANTSGTLYYYLDGTRHILLGARGTLKPSLKGNDIASIQYEFTGLLGEISDVVFPAADFSAWQTPLAIATGTTHDVTLHELYEPPFSDCSIDMGNDVKFKNLVNEQAVHINDRNVTMSFTTRVQPIATIDWYSKIRNSATGIFTLTHGTTAGNTVGLFCPAVQPKTISIADDDKTANHQLSFDVVSTGLGNNEIMFIYQ